MRRLIVPCGVMDFEAEAMRYESFIMVWDFGNGFLFGIGFHR